MASKLLEVLHTYQNHTLDSTRWHGYRPRADDIVIATSYKSGTTWMLEIVRRLVFLGRDAPFVDEIWLDARWHPLTEVMQQLEAQTHRRFIKTHLPLDGLPFYAQVKYLVVGRDARDVAMSLWNHYANYTDQFYARINDTPGRVGAQLPSCPQDIHQFWRKWITGGWFAWESEGYPFWSNLRHTQTWWNYRQLENILFVHYHDLLTDLPVEIRRIASFLDIVLPDESLTALMRAVSLDSMRRDAERLYPNLGQLWHGGVQTFYFKGMNGRWKDVFSAEELALYAETAARVLTPECRAWLEQGRLAFAH